MRLEVVLLSLAAASLLCSAGVFFYFTARGERRARELARINESPEQSAGA